MSLRHLAFGALLLFAAHAHASRLRFQWDPRPTNEGATAYVLSRATAQAGPWVDVTRLCAVPAFGCYNAAPVNLQDPAALVLFDVAPTAVGTIYYRVRGVTASGDGPNGSAVAWATVFTGAVSGLRITGVP